MESITLRKAKLRDSEFAYRAKRAAFREYVEQVWGWDEDEQRQLHERRFGVQDFRIISQGGADVGVMALVSGSAYVELKQLFILPEHQGRGIGGQCMNLIMQEAQRLGVPIRLHVLKVNLRALAFYQRLGFVRTDETDTHVLMEKTL